MDDWDNFYMLAGSTAGTLIGLIFVVITLGMDHAQEGDTLRIRIFVTPILVYFTSLLVIAMVMVPPMAPPGARRLARGHRLRRSSPMCCMLRCCRAGRRKTEEQELVWDVAVPLASFALIMASRRCLGARSAVRQRFNALGVVILLVTALRKSWIVTLGIATRD